VSGDSRWPGGEEGAPLLRERTDCYLPKPQGIGSRRLPTTRSGCNYTAVALPCQAAGRAPADHGEWFSTARHGTRSPNDTDVMRCLPIPNTPLDRTFPGTSPSSRRRDVASAAGASLPRPHAATAPRCAVARTTSQSVVTGPVRTRRSRAKPFRSPSPADDDVGRPQESLSPPQTRKRQPPFRSPAPGHSSQRATYGTSLVDDQRYFL